MPIEIMIPRTTAFQFRMFTIQPPQMFTIELSIIAQVKTNEVAYTIWKV